MENRKIEPITTENIPKMQPKPLQKKKDSDFRFGKLLGEGSFSSVYLAKEIETEREYAIKICDRDHIIREKKSEYIIREKDALSLLRNSKGIISLIYTFQDRKKLYFCLTFAPNGEILKYIRSKGSLSVETSRFYAAELLVAIEEMAKRNVIHRDLKPENLLLTKDLHLMVADFGSAKILPNDYNYEEKQAEIDRIRAEESDEDEEERRRKPKRRTSFVGTAQYVSPEILKGNAPHFASDLWAFGCILYQMLAGQPPFRAGTEYLIFKKILSREFEFPDNFPNEEAKELITQLLKYNPLDRIGAIDDERYISIRNHNFFVGVNWDEIFKHPPPPDMEILEDSQKFEISDDIEPGFGQDQQIRMIFQNEFAESPDEDVTQSVSSVTLDARRNDRQNLNDEEDLTSFLQNNETIIRKGFVVKRRGLFPRRRLLILTNSPRLIYIDPSTNIQKGEIQFDNITKAEPQDFKTFYVHTPNRIYNLEDKTGEALIWCDAIDKAKEYLKKAKT